MKSYEDMADSVFKCSNAILKKKAERRKTMRVITSTLSCFCLVALLVTGVLTSGMLNRTGPDVPIDIPGTESAQGQTDSSNTGETLSGDAVLPTETSGPAETSGNGDAVINTLSPDDPRIVWSVGMSGSHDFAQGEWNGKTITSELWEALQKDTDDSIYAVLAEIVISEAEYPDFKYNGKTVTEYRTESEEELAYINKMSELLKDGDDLKYGEELYKTGTSDGRKWSKEHYDQTVKYYGEKLLSEYIVEGEFLREKLENDLKQPVSVPATVAYYEALDALQSSVADTLEKQLSKQSVTLERKSASYTVYPLFSESADEDSNVMIDRNIEYLIIYVSKSDFADITRDNTINVRFGLADKNARNGILPFGPTDMENNDF